MGHRARRDPCTSVMSSGVMTDTLDGTISPCRLKLTTNRSRHRVQCRASRETCRASRGQRACRLSSYFQTEPRLPVRDRDVMVRLVGRDGEPVRPVDIGRHHPGRDLVIDGSTFRSESN